MSPSRRTPGPNSSWARRPPARRVRRGRIAAALLMIAAVAVAAFLLLRGGAGDDTGGGIPLSQRLVPGSAAGKGIDPLRYQPARRAAFEQRAAAGLAHPLYALSPGGAVATAERVAALRPLIEQAVAGSDVDPDVLEGMVYLESGGRPDALASNDLSGAVGLTQILAETATGLLGMHVDLAQSRRLTTRINKGGPKQAAREALRRRADERFDARKSLAATVRYLKLAQDKLGTQELAVVSYHMGIGNLQTAQDKYGSSDVPYAQLYFDSTPLHHQASYAFLASLGDSSSTYLWRVRAAEQIMARYRTDPAGLARTATLQTNKNSSEEVLRPEATTTVFTSADEIRAARSSGALNPLTAWRLRPDGLLVSPSMGELAPRLGEPRRLFRALAPEALATLLYLGAGVQAISATAPLTVTSSVRDTPYQRLLVASNIEATRAYSLHTTGFAFDLSRTYRTTAQAQAMQFMLDRLTALDVIAWVREPAAIHVTAGPRARQLLGLLRPGAPVAPPVGG